MGEAMARSSRFLWVLGLFGIGGLFVAVSQARASPSGQERSPEPLQPPPVSPADDDKSDETALARMLASETSKRAGQIVVGWITVQRAKRSGRSMYDFLTRGKGYGPFRLNGKATGRHASTVEQATAQTRELARKLLAGEIQASAAIRRHRPGSWVERKQWLTDDDVVAKQASLEEGIYARLAGTNWVLYSSDTPPISIAPFRDATTRLDALPVVAAQDPEIA